MVYMSEYPYVNLITIKISVFFFNLKLEKCGVDIIWDIACTQYIWLSSQYVFRSVFPFLCFWIKENKSQILPTGVYSIIGNVKHQHV